MERNELYLLRHAQSVGNATGDYDTSDHGLLSDRGAEQARDIAEPLSTVEFDTIAVSPTVRTRATIRPFLEASGRTAEIWPELSEGCWHEDHDDDPVETIRDGEAIALSEDELNLFEVTTREYPAQHPPDGETYAGGLDRIRKARDRVQALFEGDTSVLVVAHAHYNPRLMELMLGNEPVGQFEFENVGISKVATADDGVIPDRWVGFSNIDLRSATDEPCFP